MTTGAIKDNNIQNRSADPPLSSEAALSDSKSVGQRQIRGVWKVEAEVVVVVVGKVADGVHCSNSVARENGDPKVASSTVVSMVEAMVVPNVVTSSSLFPTMK
jgi:hypothetical protein